MLNYGLAIWSMGVVWAVFYLVPPAKGLGELVRIAFFHIPVAWVSVLAFFMSAWWAIRYLKTKSMKYDYLSAKAASLGMIFCILATISGAIFAKLSWGAYWNWDPRQTTIFILLLIYGAYLTLRNSITTLRIRAKLSAVYSLLCCVTVPFLVFIIPRYYFSLHPEPVLNSAGKLDMDSIMIWTLIASLLAFTGIFLKLLYANNNHREEGDSI